MEVLQKARTRQTIGSDLIFSEFHWCDKNVKYGYSDSFTTLKYIKIIALYTSNE